MKKIKEKQQVKQRIQCPKCKHLFFDIGVQREKDYLYFIDKEGDISKVPATRRKKQLWRNAAKLKSEKGQIVETTKYSATIDIQPDTDIFTKN